MAINLFATADSLDSIKTAALAVGIYSDGQLSPAAEYVDGASGGAIRKLIASGFVADTGRLEVLRQVKGIDSERVVVVGMGASDTCIASAFEVACRAFSKYCIDASLDEGVSALASIEVAGVSPQDRARLAASIAVQSTYLYDATLGIKRSSRSLLFRKLALWTPQDRLEVVEQGMREGMAMGNGANMARLLGDLPPNVCTPMYLGAAARRLADEFPSLEAQVLEYSEIEALGMGAFLAVARGSEEPPAFIILRHNSRATDCAPIVLVGKGVTFDSGGLSLKGAASMEEMKYDMGGAAAVFGVMRAIAELELPREVIALVPTCENMPSGKAVRPGDVLVSMSGQTIEVMNTDAEGRLILCDALTYAARFKPDVVIDVATLTGACVTALGFVHSGLFANSDMLADRLQQAGRRVLDTAWRMPLDEAYQEQLDSPFADMSNSGGAAAGAVTAACFLSRFVGAYAWAHLDVAGTARRRGKDRQATGRPVPLLVQYLIDCDTLVR